MSDADTVEEVVKRPLRPIDSKEFEELAAAIGLEATEKLVKAINAARAENEATLEEWVGNTSTDEGDC